MKNKLLPTDTQGTAISIIASQRLVPMGKDPSIDLTISVARSTEASLRNDSNERIAVV